MNRNEEVQRYLRVRHRASYTYSAPVPRTYGRAIMLPRDGGGQRVLGSRLAIEPPAAYSNEHRDFHGNRSTFFQVDVPHAVLGVDATSVVSVTRRQARPERAPSISWSRAAEVIHTLGVPGRGTPEEHGVGEGAVTAIAESTLASPLVELSESVRGFAASSFGPGTPLALAIVDLAARVSAHSGEATASELAHGYIACMRSMGQAARYVTGYVCGAVDAKGEALRGTGTLHAWASVWVPGGGWLHVDPSNDQLIDNRYVVVGWGRDRLDVTPLRGVTYTEDLAAASVDVDVDVVEVEEAEARAIAEDLGPGAPAGAAAVRL